MAARGLGERLGALRQVDHWCCESEFLELCGTTPEEVEPYVKKWWGNKALWLDMLATEIGKGLVDAAGLDKGWAATADAWLDGAYKAATAGLSCPPPRQILQRKAAWHVERVLRRAGYRQERLPLAIRQVQVVTARCDSCGLDFSQRLGKCPGCFPRAPPPAKARSPAREAEEAAAPWERLPSAQIDGALAWDQAERLAWRDGNSGGIFTLQLPSGAVCVKGGAMSVGDLFAQRLASALGVRTASMRVVPGTEDENVSIRRAMRTVAADDEELMTLVRYKMRRGDLAVVEFVNGCVMMGLPANQHLQQVDCGTWRELGRLMAFDMLLNNLDRLPLAWTNDGNLGNVMLGSSQGAVVGIDQSVHPISHPDGLLRYLDRVREAALEARDGEGRHFEAVRSAIATNTAVTPGTEALQSLRGGCLELLASVVRLEASAGLDTVLSAVSSDALSAFAHAAEIDEHRCRVAACCKLIKDVVSVAQGVLADAPAGSDVAR